MHKTRRRIFLLGAAASLVAAASTAQADSITLRDGTTLTGIVKQVDGGYEVTLDDGKHRFVAVEDAKSIKLSNEGKVTEANARERLASLQRSVESERDLDRIIDRYDQFVAMNGKTEAAKQAATALATWRDRKVKNMTKVGKRWLTPAERDASLVSAAKVVDRICAELANGSEAQAVADLRTATDEEPDNLSFLYLNGVLQLRREQFFEAKRSFDSVAERVPDHPPTLVNLAVLAVQFKRWPQAVGLLEQAMTVAPNSLEILDNVAELQQLVPEATRRTAAYERFVKHAASVEGAMEERQARRGLYRLGSKWVDKAALDQVKAELDAFEKKKNELEKDYADSQETLRKNDEQIGMLQRMIQRIEADSLVQDATGNVIRRRMPDTYWDLQRDLSRLQDQQKTTNTHIADLRKQAEVVKANAPKPPFAGKLMPIDQRGVPVLLPNSATQPTTQSSTQQATPTTVPFTMPAAVPTGSEPASRMMAPGTDAPTSSTTEPATTRPTRSLFE